MRLSFRCRECNTKLEIYLEEIEALNRKDWGAYTDMVMTMIKDKQNLCDECWLKENK